MVMRTRRRIGADRFRVVRRIFVSVGVVALTLGWLSPWTLGSGDEPGRAAVIPIRGTIDDIMRDSVDRRLEAAREAGVQTVIFEMDTPGGLVTSALDIFRAIERFEGHTVAWVNPEAYSAGALISVACDEIWMSPSSSIGDCAPIIMVPGGGVQELGETERAKAESPILQKFRDAAARNGYNQALARAMVTVGEEVWWLERVDDSSVREFVTGEEKRSRIDEIEEPEEPEWKLVENYTTGDGTDYPVEQPVDRADTLLTMGANDAVAFGFARGIVSTGSDLTSELGLSRFSLQLEQTGWELFAAWLNSPLVRGLLLVIVLIGGYIEFQSPGLILPGVTALVALAIFLAAPYAAGLENYWPLILFAVGMVLLGIEIFVLPGFGIAGGLGVLAVLVAILASFVRVEPDLPPLAFPDLTNVWQGFVLGLQVLLGSLAVSAIGLAAIVRFLPESRIATGIFTANPRAQELTVGDAHPGVAREGDVGVVTGVLKPAGQARFGQEIVDVRSQGEYIEPGQRVQVIRRDGMEIWVRPLPEDGADTA